MNKRIRKAVALILAGSGLSAASMDAGAITILGTISNTGTTSASGAEATKNGLPLYAWDGNNSHIGVPNVFSGTSKNLGWAHNSIWYDVLITKPGNYTFSLVRTNPAQPGFNPAFTLWPVGAKPFDSQNCLGHCGDINNGKNGTHSYNQVAAPSAINASAWMLGNAGTAPGGGSFNWTPREGYGAVTGFIGYANSGPVGWKNGMPINKDPGSTDYNLSQDQNEVREGYVNISTGGGLGGSTLGADSNFSAPLGGGRAALNLYNLAAGHYLLAMGGSCPLNNCGSLKNGADYRLEITEITGGAPHASAKVASPSVRAGSLVLLDGSGSFDPDGDALTYIWTQTAGPAVTLKDATTQSASFTAPDAAVGQTLGFSLTVKSNDGQQSTASLSVAITSDNTPPVVKVPSQSVLEGAEVTLSSTVTDPDGDKPASYLWKQTSGPTVVLTQDDGPTLSLMTPSAGTSGTTELGFSLTVADDYSINPKSATANTTVTVSSDPTKLRCSAATASKFSLTPNKAMVPVAIQGVTGPNPKFSLIITGVKSDEPVKNKAGKDTTGPDAKIQKGKATKKKPRTDSVLLRAERQSTGDGRVYAVSFTADDGAQPCDGVVKVEVPLTPGQVAVDGGENFDATKLK